MERIAFHLFTLSLMARAFARKIMPPPIKKRIELRGGRKAMDSEQRKSPPKPRTFSLVSPQEQRQYFALTEKSVFSQNGEDGIIEALLERLRLAKGVLCEIGIQDGRECNSANLILNNDWKGLLVEGDQSFAKMAQAFYRSRSRSDVRVVSAYVTRENLATVLQPLKSQFGRCDLLSIDIDSNDYWIWQSAQALALAPKLVIIEYNAYFGPDRNVTVPYTSPFDRFEAHYSGYYFGASLTALNRISKSNGYSLVCCDSKGANAFFVSTGLLSDAGLIELSPQDAYYELSAGTRRREQSHLAFTRIRHLPLVEAPS
jgi:hypothetical protein